LCRFPGTVELIFDQTIGHIFVTRNAGNITTSEIIASLEYGAAALGTKVILVMGYGACGAVDATIQGKAPGQISALFPHIQPAVDLAGPDVETTVKANAKIQAALRCFYCYFRFGERRQAVGSRRVL
jgi:carbonic anhydrase